MKPNVNVSSKSACDTPLQTAMPKFAGVSHVCIFVDDMMEAVDYYQKLLA